MLGRGGRGEYSSCGGIVNGGVWWLEGAAKVVRAYVAAAATVAAASPESVVWLLVCRGGSWWC